jgi:uncharacterized membrane protein YbhN (UPF0104 family)
LTVIAYGLLFSAVYLLARSADLGINFWQSAVMLSVANIVSFLPVSFSGIGTRDAVLVFFFARLGRSGEEAIVFSTLILLAVFLVSALYGFAAYLCCPLQWRKQTGIYEKSP